MNNNKWCVYIVRCADATLYTGITNGLEKRLQAHSGGTGAKYTKNRRPVELVYREAAADRSAASKREYVIKRLSRAEKLDLISKSILPP
ncbi:MAG: GIY-YIG nuclease family protein [Robiginitomaculum sp.]|nr:GIY-YIG nuclease family protein [Robiginitomaculum sp.]